MELEPFGVNVVTIFTGTVKTNIWTKDADLSPCTSLLVLSLPRERIIILITSFCSASKYYAINDQYVATRQNEAAAKGATDPEVYARWLVNATAGKRAPGWLYKGLFGTRAWLMSWAVPRGIVLGAMSSMYGVDKLGPRLKGANKKTA